MICWWGAATDTNKKCMAVYSAVEGTKFGWSSADTLQPEIEDFKRNGRFCKSGLAYHSGDGEATCAKTSSIEFQSKTLNDPYKCSPQNPDDKCKILFDIPVSEQPFTDNGSRAFVETQCRCALTDQLTGFCDEVIGTLPYESYTQQKRLTLERSQCHTLDRDDLLAQKDSCGRASDWRLLVDSAFNVTHWPYI